MRSLVTDAWEKNRRLRLAVRTLRKPRWLLMLSALLLAGCVGYEASQGHILYAMVLSAAACGCLVAASQMRATTIRPSPAKALVPNVPVNSRTAFSDRFCSEIVLQLAAQGTKARQPVRPSKELSANTWRDLMARVSHELRTPLNAVIGFSDVMGAEMFGPVGDDRYREYVAHIRHSGRELLKSAEDTLAVTALLCGRVSATDALSLAVIAGEAASGIGEGAVDIDVEANVDVIGERNALRQAMANLIREGRLRAGAGGSVRVSASCEDEFVVVEVTAQQASNSAREPEPSLHVCMARVLLELQGSHLIDMHGRDCWRAVTVLSRATQPDFFAKVNDLSWPALPNDAEARVRA